MTGIHLPDLKPSRSVPEADVILVPGYFWGHFVRSRDACCVPIGPARTVKVNGRGTNPAAIGSEWAM